ncbi:unnamed protein product [Musa hybrid cultivar]
MGHAQGHNQHAYCTRQTTYSYKAKHMYHCSTYRHNTKQRKWDMLENMNTAKQRAKNTNLCLSSLIFDRYHVSRCCHLKHSCHHNTLSRMIPFPCFALLPLMIHGFSGPGEAHRPQHSVCASFSHYDM